jgi:polyisoprenoid-binding protein YceI
MMKKLMMTVLLAAGVLAAGAQTKFFTKTGRIQFNASSPLEKIEASNEKATSVIDVSTGAMEFAVLMKGFIFDKALMQEHFNENYVESDKYPKAVFKGTVVNMKEVDLSKDGVYPVKVKGMLTLHGETKEVMTDGTLTVKDGQVSAGKTEFTVALADYKIEVPSLVKDKISKDVKVTVDVNYEPFKTS